jgi:hypothetical protein
MTSVLLALQRAAWEQYVSPTMRSRRLANRAHELSHEFAGATLVTCLFFAVYYLVIGVRAAVRTAMDMRELKEDGDPNGLTARATTVVDALDATAAHLRANMLAFTVLLWIHAATVSEPNACIAGIAYVLLTLVGTFARVASSEWRALPLLLPMSRRPDGGSIDAAWSSRRGRAHGAGASYGAYLRVIAVLQGALIAYLLVTTAIRAMW